MKRAAIIPEESGTTPDKRERVLEAAFATFMERGYAGAGTLEIATRAKVSKRELYTLFGSKQGLIAALVAKRSAEMRRPLDLPPARDRVALAATLAAFGAGFLKQISLPSSTALFRLAIIEAERAPELARTLNEAGRETLRAAMTAFIHDAQAAGLVVAGKADTLAGRFFALLIGDLPMRLVMGVAKPPRAKDITAHAEAVTALWLGLHGRSDGSPP